MATKRKISVRKILQVFLTVVVSTGCIIAIISASRIEDSKMLSSVAVHIKNDKKRVELLAGFHLSCVYVLAKWPIICDKCPQQAEISSH